MAVTKHTSDKSSSRLFQAFSKAFDWSAAFGLFFSELKKSFQNQADLFLCRVEYLLTLYLWISIGLVFLIIGLFDLIMDFTKASRGVVYSIGGLVIFLTAFILLQAVKIKKMKQRR
jgi:hypothetical protein